MPQYSDQGKWELLSAKQRCAIVGRVAAQIADVANELASLSLSDQRKDPVETITAELLPLCSALRFISRRGGKILRDRRHGFWGRPGWLWGVRSVVQRDPHGTVLILGTWNYPLFLPGVQIAQALAGGNQVTLKPAIGCEAISESLINAFHRAGVPMSALKQLDSDTRAAEKAIESGVDLVVLTGSAKTGSHVLQQTAQTATATIMELSGCDAVVVLPETRNIDHVAQCVDFGLRFNSGATCIAPRRLIAEPTEADKLVSALRLRFANAEPMQVHPAARPTVTEIVPRAISRGAVDVLNRFDQGNFERTGKLFPLILDQVQPEDEITATDLFAPVTSIIRVPRISDAVQIVNDCPYRLAASVFGPSRIASQFGRQLRVGSVCVNDLIVPTADPRVPFGGRGRSGFGVTRGAEGLLDMTVPTVLSQRRGKFAPHLRSRQPSDAQTLIGALQLLHSGTLGKRWRGIRKMVSAVSNKEPTVLGKKSPTDINPSMENQRKS